MIAMRFLRGVGAACAQAAAATNRTDTQAINQVFFILFRLHTIFREHLWRTLRFDWTPMSTACSRLAVARSTRTTIHCKSTRLNSSHLGSSYAVFCLKNRSE